MLDGVLQDVSNFLSLWTKSYDVTIQMKASEQYFPVVLFIMLYKVVLTFESVDEILWSDHSNESFWVVLSRGTVYYAVQGGSNFWVCGWNPMMWPFKKKFSACSFTWCYLFSEIWQNEIWTFGRNLPLAKFGSERVEGIYVSSKWDLLFNLCRIRKVMWGPLKGTCHDVLVITCKP